MAFLDRVTRRRLVLGLLLAVSLALLTVYFREQDSGQLHGVQRSLSNAASPVEGAMQRVAQPFRDGWGWSRDLVHAKSERDKLAKENAALKQEIGQLLQQRAVNNDAQQLLNFKNDPRFATRIGDAWNYVAARVTERAPTVYNSKVQIDVGTADGVHKHDPVITGEGWLVGQITDVSSGSSWVTLINDGSAGEGAWIPNRGARGLVTPSSGDRNILLLTEVPKTREVRLNDLVMTQGWKAPDDPYHSIFPAGLVIGRVSNVAVPETSLEQQIQVTPYADLSSFHSVLVLDPKRPIR